jgi:hypothetical protein
LLLIPKANERQKNDKMLATTTTTTPSTHEWCRWVVVDFLCVFPIVKTANKLTTLIAKDQTSWGTSGWKYIGSSWECYIGAVVVIIIIIVVVVVV